jgi:hypothetical protein
MLFVLVSLYNAQSFVNEINQFVFIQKKIIVLAFFSLTGGSSRLRHRVKVDSGIGLLMVNVLESTLEWTLGDVIDTAFRTI